SHPSGDLAQPSQSPKIRLTARTGRKRPSPWFATPLHRTGKGVGKVSDAASRGTAALPILMYHNIARAPRDLRVYRSLFVSPAAFARQMWLLRRLGYIGLSMSAAMPYLRGE